MFDQYMANLNEKTCSCRYSEKTWIIYKHVVAAIWEHIQNGEKKHKTLNTRAMYSNKIDPINGRNMWPRSICPTTLLGPKHHIKVS
uniref:SWIM-type domain-containing protein n=1 Tax=Lactuca sativa TaxID=4236 RepID=A0A9R1XIA6_LACSA|nr:hypothetical protein LSAT_V11C400204110 [Lactuca sativa]